ncbi:hypothetical protein J1TS3_17230 [Siminovitchia fordii]|uniref:Lipoprotein n=2 Tax=Siminovitchia fordii TaxID=254759 RepID=A0ABQ4K4C6_9BACI|nr:hypothetical protein J1TS3_17230 [Siminovitchia fordii]
MGKVNNMRILTRYFLLFILVVSALVGCNTSNSSEAKDTVNREKNQESGMQENIKDIAKAQKVEVHSADNGTVLKTMSEKADIEEFIESLKLDGWEYASDLPKDAEKQYEYVFSIEDTTKLGERKEKKPSLHEVARLITFKDIPYVTLKVSLIKIDMKVPDDVAEQLNSSFSKQ